MILKIPINSLELLSFKSHLVFLIAGTILLSSTPRDWIGEDSNVSILKFKKILFHHPTSMAITDTRGKNSKNPNINVVNCSSWG